MNSIKQSGENSPVPKFGLGLLALLAVSIIPLVILIGSQQPFSSTEGAEFVQIPQVSHSDQEIVVSAHKTTLYVPKDGIDFALTGSFVILPHEPDIYSYASGSEWTRPIVVDIQYWNEEGVLYPDITFSKPASICFALTPEQWKGFTQSPDDFQVQYFDNDESPFRWIALPLATDPGANELCAQTDHLSIYALAIKPGEEIPVTGPTLTPIASPAASSTATNIINTPEERNRDTNNAPLATARPPQATQPPVQPPPTEPPPTEPPPTEPPVETEEPPVETEEPPVETEEPPVETEEPPVETEEPPVETEEPPVETEEPPAPGGPEVPLLPLEPILDVILNN